MNSKRFNLLMMLVAFVLSLAFVGAVYIGNQLLKKQSDKLTSLKLDAEVADEQQKSLIQAKSYIEKYEKLGEDSRSIVPQDKDQARAVREIVKIAGESGVSLSSVTFPSSTLGTAQSKVTTPIKTTDSKTTAVKSPSITQVKAVSGIPGVFGMEVTIQSDSTKPIQYPQFIRFLEKIENNRRTAHVISVDISPEIDSAQNLSFTLILNLYIKP